jgi:hypothetical protein
MSQIYTIEKNMREQQNKELVEWINLKEAIELSQVSKSTFDRWVSKHNNNDIYTIKKNGRKVNKELFLYDNPIKKRIEPIIQTHEEKIKRQNEENHKNAYGNALVKKTYKEIYEDQKVRYKVTVISLSVLALVIISGITVFFLFHSAQIRDTYLLNKKSLIENYNNTLESKNNQLKRLDNELISYKKNELNYINKLAELNKTVGKSEATIMYNNIQINNFKNEILKLKKEIKVHNQGIVSDDSSLKTAEFKKEPKKGS